MKIDYLIDTLKKQNFPKDQYAVFGSAVMAVRGMREAPNIDVIVTDKLWTELLDKRHKPDEEGFIRIAQIKISNWWFAPTRKNIPTMIKEAEIIKGVPFVRLEEVRDYKTFVNRDKDKNDVKLIDQFLSTTSADEPTALGIETYQRLLDIFKTEIDKRLGDKILSLVIFGSVSRGEAKGSSDIDIFTFFDNSKIKRNELNEILTSIILGLRKTDEYMKLTDKKIYPEIYPFLISKSKARDYLWVSFDATEQGLIIKDTGDFAKDLIKEIKTKIGNIGGRRVELASEKTCWILYDDFSYILENKINL
ncbi:MAG: nucleotidyltransferase domain-containing protein [Candidatus Woesebacteria bacterium]|nr:MAG: nucleotidyltransferase domain-containing protein [Candidatus Woesebacteria bacterium]